MPQDVKFVRFIAGRYAALHGHAAVVVGLALLVVAPILARPWQAREHLLLAGVGGAAVLAGVLNRRYYERNFGRTRQTEEVHRHPWLVAGALFLLEALTRSLADRSIHSGALAVGLGGAVAVKGWMDRAFRPHVFLVAAALLYVGADRLTGSSGQELGAWLQRSAGVVGTALMIHGFFDHRLIASGLSAGHRRLAMSSTSVPVAPGLPSVARDPVAATILTALEACEEADLTFIANVSGLVKEDAASWVAALEQVDLVRTDEASGDRGTAFVRLTPDGHDIARSLWPATEAALAGSGHVPI